jgi:hypothetical protein
MASLRDRGIAAVENLHTKSARLTSGPVGNAQPARRLSAPRPGQAVRAHRRAGVRTHKARRAMCYAVSVCASDFVAPAGGRRASLVCLLMIGRRRCSSATASAIISPSPIPFASSCITQVTPNVRNARRQIIASIVPSANTSSELRPQNTRNRSAGCSARTRNRVELSASAARASTSNSRSGPRTVFSGASSTIG